MPYFALMFKKQLYAILIMLLASVMMLEANAYNVKQYNHWVKVSTEELMRRGQDYLQNKGWVDSAMASRLLLKAL